jgi:hypothetical protein
MQPPLTTKYCKLAANGNEVTDRDIVDVPIVSSRSEAKRRAFMHTY